MVLKTQARRAWSARSASGKWSLALLIGLTFAQAAAGPEKSLKDQPHIRGPVAAAWIIANCRVAVANRCGTVSIVDKQANVVLDEIRVGKRLATIKSHPSGQLWLAVDEQGHELIELVRAGKSLHIARRHSVPQTPVDLAFNADGSRVGVISLWSRKLTTFAITSDKGARALSPVGELTLNFNPGKIEIRSEEFREPFSEHRLPPVLRNLPEHSQASKPDRFLVHDAFGGARAVVNGNANPPYVVANRRDSSSYLGGSYSWGDTLYSLHIKDSEWRLNYGLLSGAKSLTQPISAGTETFFFSDVLIPLGPGAEPTSIQRGERHFLEMILGENVAVAFSCANCHKRGHTSYERYDTVADGTNGAPKRVPTLLGTRLTDPWAWNGHFRDLSEQVRSSIEHTMRIKNFTPEQVADITAYLHTLPPPPPLEPATDDPIDKKKLAHGKQLFHDLGCAKCHIPPLTYTSPDTYDVGIEDEKGLKKFNPPSLRGVSQGYTFFHDGRAKSLAEVFTVHGHQLNRELEQGELNDLLRFLRSL